MDYYFNFVTGKIKRGPPGCPVAIESNFGWILSGPNGTAKKKSKFVSSNIANSHTMFVDNLTRKTDDYLSLKGSIQRFWEVENVGVDEHPVYENFKQTISFDGERYVTALPFKPFHKPLPDNYTLSKHRLSILKTKLDKNEELKQEYSQVFVNYLKDSIIEKVADNEDISNSDIRVEHLMKSKNFSSLEKLLLVASYVLRFKNNSLAKIRKTPYTKGVISTKELKFAEKLWIYSNQRKIITSSKFSQLKKSLGIFYDKENTLRVKG